MRNAQENPRPPEKLLLTIQELSQLTGIAVGSLYHWVSEKRIPVIRISARCIRFDLQSIRDWIAQKTEHPVDFESVDRISGVPPRNRFSSKQTKNERGG